MMRLTSDLVLNQNYLTQLIKKNLLVMRTFSKAWGLPGIRLGFIVGQKKLIEYISKCRSLVETNGFSLK